MTYSDVAVLIPCHNEASTVVQVVEGFREHLPGARIVVCDNNSTDGTADLARNAGAVVVAEHHRGKGYAVRRLFSDVDADFFIMVDGDATYAPEAGPEIIRLMREDGVDTVLAVRDAQSSGGSAEYRIGHQLGNRVFSRTFSFLFDTAYTDVLTGYRGFSRRFVKSCPLLARGFDVEIELNAHGASLGMPWAEVRTPYVERISGSESKLNTYSDGLRIFRRLFRLFRDFRPALSFGGLGLLLGLIGAATLVPLLVTYESTGTVPRFPTLFVVVGLFLAALFLVLVGAILDRAARDRLERNRLAYLSVPAPWQHRGPHGTSVPGDTSFSRV
ncbi:glycosyltransferase family 2 protein [Modestobacter sp. VKM Ac-2977]|uniref:glycosyltransferase family 2 protein n=1 Tax=Modestobacter sp. VKM Ac-2977 TaxID=3004131 RepID=UPI0022AAD4F3|nr:glycosyltransferase family 2 protein [Modestobacter sp. VKM Ac-2977]MCZ2822351.1 glycosyltransferase family 2 protein [Modestobacter sp. VKM Ac-2977]